MKYSKARFINNGEEMVITLASITDVHRWKYRDKLYCPEEKCMAKLSEYKVDGKVFYRANPNSHNEDCIYKNEIVGYRDSGDSADIEINISEEHLELSVRRSYKRSKEENIINLVDGGNNKKQKSKIIKKSDDGDIKYRVKGVVNSSGIKGPKEPPILNRNEITKLDVGYTRKIVDVEVDRVEEISRSLKILFKDKRYNNLYALIGDSYIAENNIDYNKIMKINKYVEFNIKNKRKVSFCGAGTINEFKGEFIMELFFQESFLINGKSISAISAWVDMYLSN